MAEVVNVDVVGGFDIIAFMGSPTMTFVYGAVIFTIIFIVIYFVFLKGRKDTEIFEFESFGDTVYTNMERLFKTEGHRSKGKLLHGFNNKLGNVQKWVQHKGEWVVMEYDVTKKQYSPKQKVNKIPIMDNDGKQKKNKKGKLLYKTEMEEVKQPYDLYIFKIKGDGMFESKSYIVADAHYIKYDPKGNVYRILDDAQLSSFGKCWITSPKGEQYLCNISYRKSIENNMTYTQNYAGKIIFIETNHAKTIGRIEGKALSKSAGYQTHATNTLMREGTDTEEDDT